MNSNGIQLIGNSPLAKSWIPYWLNLRVLTDFAASAKSWAVNSNNRTICLQGLLNYALENAAEFAIINIISLTGNAEENPTVIRRANI